MEPLLSYSLSHFPAYLAYAASLAVLLTVAVVIYLFITPYKEIALIRQGNSAAAISFAGVLLGFALPLNAVGSSAGSLLDMLMWSVIALVSQLAAFLLASRLLGDLRSGIEHDKMAHGILLAALSVTVGLINAASLTY
ncbi:DUF350 domain-containing protein [Oleisolibacter albus]|uniref:DUF350 domain-containing protein n=1 Tax=Oleisolibacter albus TaxID=2171757 RepID=UPI000DF235F6|nr:DUF350 domain-containing protein [Oleisolibacter albus]